MDQQILFYEGMEGYASFRIPTVLSLPGGRVIAFCEGRRDSDDDCGTIRIVARVSRDGGESFGPLQVVCSHGEDTANNPCPVFDRRSGRLHLVYNTNLKKGRESLILKGEAPRTVHHVFSDDLGESWSAPRDITSQVKPESWTWYACGPCHGAQLPGGRLLIPCNHAVLKPEGNASGPYISHAIYSDDGGQSWQTGGDVGENTNECSLAPLGGERVYINMRSYHGKGCRAAAWSEDGGQSWQGLRLEERLPDPVCQGSVLAVDSERPEGLPILLFSNAPDPKERVRLTLRKSRDGGRSWSRGTLIWDGPSAYSDLAALEDGRIGCLYEGGGEHAYEGIRWARVEMEGIE